MVIGLDLRTPGTHSMENAPKYKITVLGSPGVGKTAILFQLTQQYFHEHLDPTISDSFNKISLIDKEYANMLIQDTAGQDAFKTMREQYTRTAHGFLLVYSIADPESFNNIQNVYRSILQIKDVDTFPCVILVANKQDLTGERKVSPEDEDKLAAKLNLQLIPTSAYNGLNIEEAFARIVVLIRRDRAEKQSNINQAKTNARAVGSNNSNFNHQSPAGAAASAGQSTAPAKPSSSVANTKSNSNNRNRKCFLL